MVFLYSTSKWPLPVEVSFSRPCKPDMMEAETFSNPLLKQKPLETAHIQMVFPAIPEALGPCWNSQVHAMSNYSSADPRRTCEYLKNHSKDISNELFEILGDNIDWTIHPTYMTEQRQNRSIHWFYVLAKEKSVIASHLSDDKPQGDIRTENNSVFLPSDNDLFELKECFAYHIANILVKYIPFLASFASCIPKYIPHENIDKASQKGNYFITKLLEKNENLGGDIIEILQYFHEAFIPNTEDEHPRVLQKTVFGGDQMTNERAYTAQQAMVNGDTDYEKLGGVIHRCEGLHTVMNLVQLIFKEFYRPKSSGAKGSLYCLRNIINRRDVTGYNDVTKAFRSHHTFVDDCLDAFITAAATDHFGLTDITDNEEKPKANCPHPMLKHSDMETQYGWLKLMAVEIIDRYILTKRGTPELYLTKWLTNSDNSKRMMDVATDDDGKFACGVLNPNCVESFRHQKKFTKHLEEVHGTKLSLKEKKEVNICKCPATDGNEDCEGDTGELMAASFMMVALLCRDTYDAHRFGDGERAFRNGKFEMLYDTKYALWHWRMQAYVQCILSERMAYEYKWNISFNQQGGAGQCIPNDNLVELAVKSLKDKMKSQGANLTFQSVDKASRSIQILDAVQSQWQSTSGVPPRGKSRPKVSKKGDVTKMVKELVGLFQHSCGRRLVGFPDFSDPISQVNEAKLDKWITDQKRRAWFEMCLTHDLKLNMHFLLIYIE